MTRKLSKDVRNDWDGYMVQADGVFTDIRALILCHPIVSAIEGACRIGILHEFSINIRFRLLRCMDVSNISDLGNEEA